MMKMSSVDIEMNSCLALIESLKYEINIPLFLETPIKLSWAGFKHSVMCVFGIVHVLQRKDQRM